VSIDIFNPKIVDIIGEKLKKKVDCLKREIPDLITGFNNLGYGGPSQYALDLYKHVIVNHKNRKVQALLKDEKFIKLLYDTLCNWGMNKRGAKMKPFDDFLKNIQSNSEKILKLSKFKLHEITKDEIWGIKSALKDLFLGLDLMESKGTFVSNSKVMHYVLPDLVMPMDRTYTLTFFYGNGYNINNPTKKFLDVFTCSWLIAKDIDLSKYLDDNWNQTIPKVIDNAIIYKVSSC